MRDTNGENSLLHRISSGRGTFRRSSRVSKPDLNRRWELGQEPPRMNIGRGRGGRGSGSGRGGHGLRNTTRSNASSTLTPEELDAELSAYMQTSGDRMTQ